MLTEAMACHTRVLVPAAVMGLTAAASAQDWQNYAVPASAGSGNLWSLVESLSDGFNYGDRTPAFYDKWRDTKPDYWYGDGVSRIIGGELGPYRLDDPGKLTLYATPIPEGHPDRGAVRETPPGSGWFTDRRIYTPYITSEDFIRPGMYSEAMINAGHSPMSSNFWMISDSNLREIDVLEVYGDGNWYPRHPSTAVHYNPNGAGPGDISNRFFHPHPQPVTGEWVRYGVYWKSQTELDFYYNGQLIRSLNLPVDLPDPEGRYLDEDLRLVLNIRPHGWRQEAGVPSAAQLADEALNRMQVDWVRTYEVVADPNAGQRLFEDDFSGPALNETVWNTGGGFLFDAQAGNVRLDTFGQAWGARGDNHGAAGLNSTVGIASFTVADDGTRPIGGNFQIGSTAFNDSAKALARFALDLEGAGLYELVWNNSGQTEAFETASGWTGTLAGNAYAWIINGDTANAHTGATDNSSVNIGDAATAFGFWHTDPNTAAVIDDVVLWDSLTVAATGGTSGDYNNSGLVEQGDLDQVLANWGQGFAGLPASWVNQRPTEGIVDQAELDVVLQNWGSNAVPDFSNSTVPEPAAISLLVTVLAALRCPRSTCGTA